MTLGRLVGGGFSLVVLAATLYAGAVGVGPVPALGTFLDPVRGVWAVADQTDIPRDASLTIPGTKDSVVVVFDDRAVPHVFARNEDDLYRAVGYLHARFRLFQLEIQTRATDGTLTELVGPRALPLDRRERALGLAWAARREWAALDTASHTAHLLEAYAAGINARIAELKPEDIPLEYRLFGKRPMHWEPYDTFVLLKRMGYTLAYSTDDLWLAKLGDLVGPSVARALVPTHSPIEEPVVPAKGRRYPHFAFEKIPPPKGAGLAASPGPAFPKGPPVSPAHSDLGSNNWAVAPSRSASHHALLAGDPHLDLTLPSIWFEMQQVIKPSPDKPATLDVYGVTIPGAPPIIIGFNRDVAWSFTNTGNDVLDWYNETLNDSLHPTAYRLDGAWHRLDRRIERYLGPHGHVLAVDTLYMTHRGPLFFQSGHARSMRWTVLDNQGAVDAFDAIQYATSVTDWMRRFAPYRAPTQNALVADRAGHIAIRSTGAYPIRPGGDGRHIFDGSTRANDWRGYLPVSAYPFAEDPKQGFLASDNQEPVDPRADSTYLGANWASPWRAMRINELLRADSAVTPDAMRRFQTDPGSPRADYFVPFFLAAAKGRGGTVARAAHLLAQWDRRYTKDNERAVLFEAAMRELERRTWDELMVHSANGAPPRLAYLPGSDVLAELLADSTNPWWDDRRTPTVEHRDDILAASLAAALDTVQAHYGPPDAGGWRWDGIRHANIYHLLGFPSLSALGLPVAAGPNTLTPISGSGRHGPSWRMVVELGPEVRAWSIYPGGQSGNPVSPWYMDRIPKWVNGELDPVQFPRTPAALAPAHRLGRITIEPGGR